MGDNNMLGDHSSMITNFSFTVKTAAGNTNHWSPSRTGNYTADCAVGRSAGLEVIEHLQNGGAPNILGSIIRDMMAGDIYEGAEVGFCAALAQHIQAT